MLMTFCRRSAMLVKLSRVKLMLIKLCRNLADANEILQEVGQCS